MHFQIYSLPFCREKKVNLVFIVMNSKNYGITIKEMNQPLLVHRPKERSKPGGKVDLCPTIIKFLQ